MSNYGNVPDDDVDAVSHAVRAATRVADGLPPTVPSAWKSKAFELTLEGILQDWVNNGTTELDSDDEEDLTNLLRLAADLAAQQPADRQEAVFRIIGKSVMRDWVDNWNSDEE
jgi:hypothetical protein